MSVKIKQFVPFDVTFDWWLYNWGGWTNIFWRKKRFTFSLRWMRSNNSPFSAYSSTIKMSLLVSMNSKCLMMCGWLKRRSTLISRFTFSKTPCSFILRLFRIFIATLWLVISFTATTEVQAVKTKMFEKGPENNCILADLVVSLLGQVAPSWKLVKKRACPYVWLCQKCRCPGCAQSDSCLFSRVSSLFWLEVSVVSIDGFVGCNAIWCHVCLIWGLIPEFWLI